MPKSYLSSLALAIDADAEVEARHRPIRGQLSNFELEERLSTVLGHRTHLNHPVSSRAEPGTFKVNRHDEKAIKLRTGVLRAHGFRVVLPCSQKLAN